MTQISHKVSRRRKDPCFFAAQLVETGIVYSSQGSVMSSNKFSGRKIRRPGPSLTTLSLFLAFFLALPPRFEVLAGDILRGGSPAATSHGAAVEGQTAAAVQAGAPNGRDTLARTTQALNAVRNMQAAARAAAMKGPNNLGADPNHPGLRLPNVPNGLTPGGLQV